MRSLSRLLRRLDLLEAAVLGLGLAFAAVLAAVIAALAYGPAARAGLAVAAALLLIVGGGLLYAWRPGTGGLLD